MRRGLEQALGSPVRLQNVQREPGLEERERWGQSAPTREGGNASLRHFRPSRRIKHSAKVRRRRKRFSRQNPDQPKRVASLPQQSAGQYLDSCANPATKRGRYTDRGRRELSSCPALLLSPAGLPVSSCDRGSRKIGAAPLARGVGPKRFGQQAQRLRRLVKKRLRAQNAQPDCRAALAASLLFGRRFAAARRQAFQVGGHGVAILRGQLAGIDDDIGHVRADRVIVRRGAGLQ